MECAEIFADDGFAGERDVIGGGDQVEIDAADYHDGLAHFAFRLRNYNSGKDVAPMAR
jgi:hypothetical protein